MEPYLNNPFEILFDTTEFSSTRAIPIHWLTQFFQLVFSEMNDYLVSLHLYNPNTYLQRYIRRLPRAIVNKLVKRTHFSSTLVELNEHIATSMIKLPKETGKFIPINDMFILLLLHPPPTSVLTLTFIYTNS
jgi:neurofibromin 1